MIAVMYCLLDFWGYLLVAVHYLAVLVEYSTPNPNML